MRVELLTVGDEVLRGDVVNGAAAWLGRRLTDAGAEVGRVVVLPDDVEAIASAVEEAAGRADAVITTGGLGGTCDDLTRDALARAAGVGIRRDPDLVRALRERAASRGIPLREGALRMADVPDGATLLPNPAGTAPGLRLVLPRATVYALPGVQAEMRAIAEESVLAEVGGRAVVVRVLRTATVWESVISDRLGPVEELPGVRLAYYPSPAEVAVRVEAADGARLAAAEAAARDLLGSAVYGTDDATLDRVVHRLLAERAATVAVAESLTGGLVGAELTGMPGSSATFTGGVVAYATALKHSLLGVPEDLLAAHGAVHPDVAVAMAVGVRERLGATYGLATTGVAGPEPQDGRPVGTLHVAVTGSGDRASVRSVRLPAAADGGRGRAPIRRMSVVHALDLLRRFLLNLDPKDAWMS